MLPGLNKFSLPYNPACAIDLYVSTISVRYTFQIRIDSCRDESLISTFDLTRSVRTIHSAQFSQFSTRFYCDLFSYLL